MSKRSLVMVAALMLNAVWCQPKALAQCEATEHAKLLASDGTYLDAFGGSIALSGNRAVVGDFQALPAPGGQVRAGNTAYVLSFDGVRWREEGRLVPGDILESGHVGVRVAISGDVVLLAVAFWGDNEAHLGAVNVFRFDGQNWIEEEKLMASDGTLFNGLNSGLAITGDTALVGVPSMGAVYTFHFADGAWTEDVRLMPSEGAVGSLFGSAIAVSGHNTVVVGAPGDDDHGEDSGAAYVFRFDGTSWTEEAKLTASDGAPSAWLGFDVALSGDTALLGARGLNGNNPDHLAAYVFRRDKGTWREEAKLTSVVNSDQYYVDLSSVAVSGNVAILALPGDRGDYDRSGAAYMFQFDGTEWVEQPRLTASDNAQYDRFGAAVALLDDVAFIGATGDDDNGNRAGAAYVFRGLSDCNQNDIIDSCEVSTGGAGDCNANGIPDACDIAAGVSGDCQPNGVPDECELGRYVHSSERLTLSRSTPEFTIPSPPPARGIVSLRFTIGHRCRSAWRNTQRSDGVCATHIRSRSYSIHSSSGPYSVHTTESGVVRVQRMLSVTPLDI
ncbi:MAG: hypothetical protein IIC51_08165 [Planctomycetes bacterium]|nr:hypothetical protein [Planctomycetota bacterium]